MKRARFAVVLAVLVAVVAALVVGFSGRVPGWYSGQPARRPGPLRVVVSIAPLSGLVAALAPADAEVKTLVPPGRSLHGYEMAPADLAALGNADLVVYVGLGLEPQLEAFLSRRPRDGRRVLSFAKAVGLADGSAAHVHHEGDEHGHDHGAADPHLWLDPLLVQQFVVALRLELEEAQKSLPNPPGRAETDRLSTAAAGLLSRVAEVDTAYRARLAPFAGASIVTHHNAFSRLADRYALKIAAVIRPIEDAEPTPAQIAAAVDAVRKQDTRAVFVEPQFSPAAAERIAEQAGVKVGVLDPEGRADWFELMLGNLDELERLLAAGGE